jgi:hypothetical protein
MVATTVATSVIRDEYQEMIQGGFKETHLLGLTFK